MKIPPGHYGKLCPVRNQTICRHSPVCNHQLHHFSCQHKMIGIQIFRFNSSLPESGIEFLNLCSHLFPVQTPQIKNNPAAKLLHIFTDYHIISGRFRLHPVCCLFHQFFRQAIHRLPHVACTFISSGHGKEHSLLLPVVRKMHRRRPGTRTAFFQYKSIPASIIIIYTRNAKNASTFHSSRC